MHAHPVHILLGRACEVRVEADDVDLDPVTSGESERQVARDGFQPAHGSVPHARELGEKSDSHGFAPADAKLVKRRGAPATPAPNSRA